MATTTHSHKATPLRHTVNIGFVRERQNRFKVRVAVRKESAAIVIPIVIPIIIPIIIPVAISNTATAAAAACRRRGSECVKLGSNRPIVRLKTVLRCSQRARPCARECVCVCERVSTRSGRR